MFREMRRRERQISSEEAQRILCSEDYGVLSVIGDGGYPYGVPVNYACADGKLYFHCTDKRSHKLDAIGTHDKVCFTVVSGHQLVPEDYSTNYESVIVFGTARILKEPEEKLAAMAKMMDVLAPDVKEAALRSCGRSGYVMVEITPEHITGKARIKNNT